MKKIVRKLDSTITWHADTAEPPINLPRDGLITEVRLRLHMKVKVTMVGQNAPDAHRRIIQNVSIEGDGGKVYFGYNGEQTGRILALMNNCDFQSSLCSYISGATEDFTFIFHPGSNPQDPFDMSAVIPARELANLQLKVEFAGADVFAFSATLTDDIESGTGYVTVFSVLDVPTPRGIMTPQGSTFTWYNSTAAIADLGKEIRLRTGAYLRRIAVLCQDETPVAAGVSGTTGPARTDAEVTEAGLILPKIGARILDVNIEDLKQLTATRYGLPSVVPFQKDNLERVKCGYPDGFFIIDFRDWVNDPIGKKYGLNLTGYEVGDILLGLSCAAAGGPGEDTLIYWDQLVPFAK